MLSTLDAGAGAILKRQCTLHQALVILQPGADGVAVRIGNGKERMPKAVPCVHMVKEDCEAFTRSELSRTKFFDRVLNFVEEMALLSKSDFAKSLTTRCGQVKLYSR